MVRNARRWLSGVACIGLLAAVAGAPVDSPKYKAWAKYKPGSSATMVADMDMGQVKVTVTMTRTLAEITATEAKVTVTTAVTAMGHDQPPKTQTETLPAQSTDEPPKVVGTEDVTAAGKTYSCKVYEVTGVGLNMMGGHGRPGAAAAGAPGGKAKVYVSDDVPGGMVKMVAETPAGPPLTFVVTAVNVK